MPPPAELRLPIETERLRLRARGYGDRDVEDSVVALVGCRARGRGVNDGRRERPCVELAQ